MTDIEDRIIVVDSPTGSGKTTWAIEYISHLDPEVKVIFITPYIKEVERIIRDCKSRFFVQPVAWRGEGRKINHLIELVAKGSNIASTHALFTMIDDDLINVLKANNYVLILDEVMNVVEKFNLYKDVAKVKQNEIEQFTREDITNLQQNEYIVVNDDYMVQWTDKPVLHKYESLKRLADRDMLYLVNNSLLLWTFPIEVFREGIFSQIFILTYQFDYQMQALYYKYFNLQYGTYHIEGKYPFYKLVPTMNKDYEKNWVAKVKPLIHVLDNPKLNRIGSGYRDAQNREVLTALSKNWYNKNPELIPILKSNCDNLYNNIFKSKDKMWTTFKDSASKIKSSRMPAKNNFVEINARATNDFSHKTKLAYLINRYPDPFFEDFFEKKGIRINQDGFALSEMVQWVFRSAIRNSKEIDIYIPSERMRSLLINWLNGDNP